MQLAGLEDARLMLRRNFYKCPVPLLRMPLQEPICSILLSTRLFLCHLIYVVYIVLEHEFFLQY